MTARDSSVDGKLGQQRDTKPFFHHRQERGQAGCRKSISGRAAHFSIGFKGVALQAMTLFKQQK